MGLDDRLQLQRHAAAAAHRLVELGEELVPLQELQDLRGLRGPAVGTVERCDGFSVDVASLSREVAQLGAALQDLAVRALPSEQPDGVLQSLGAADQPL